MLKILEAVDLFIKRVSENIARTVNRKTFIKTVMASAFASLAVLTVNVQKGSAAAYSWCEAWGSYCSPPNNKTCPGCNSSSKCPSGYKVSKAWGYQSTGCWCATGGGGWDWVCCDCTKGANVNTQYSADCGCSLSIKSNTLV